MDENGVVVTTPEPMTIGEFAALTRLSPKALRLYDSLGLLPPADTDPSSGYRFYLPGQVERARRIRMLRDVGLPLAQIGELLDLPGPDAARAVREYWAEVDLEHTARRRHVLYLANLMDEGTNVHEIQTREVPEQKVLSTQRNVRAQDLPTFIQGAGDEIVAYLTKQGTSPAGPAFVIYHSEVTAESEGTVEVCVPFEGHVEPDAGGTYPIGIRVEPAHTEAYARITQAEVRYPTILQAYDAVAQWLLARDQKPSGPPREIYFADWGSIGDDDPACDVAFPWNPH